MTAALALDGPLRAVVELPLVLLLPGTSILAALRGVGPARPASDVGLAVVLSFAAWILISLAAFAVGQPLTTTVFIVGSNVVVGVSAVICAVRRAPLTTIVGSDARRGQVALVLLAAVAVAGCCAAVAIGASDTRAPSPYSEVALAGQWAGVSSVVSVTRGAPVSVDLVVANHTSGTRSYTVVPAMSGARWTVRTVRLDPGMTWRGSVRGTVPVGGCLHRLLVTVNESGAAAPVGTVTLWFQNGTRLPKACRP